MSNEAIIEIQEKAISAQDNLMIEKEKNISMNNKLSAALRCLLKIKETYPDVYKECLNEDDIRAVLGLTPGSERRRN